MYMLNQSIWFLTEASRAVMKRSETRYTRYRGATDTTVSTTTTTM
jgi:hypothetical protein